MVGQSANLATEAHELASEAGEAIKASRETIKAALRGLGAASDISEVSGPTRASRPAPARPAMGSLNTGWAPGGQSAASVWSLQSTPATITWPPPELEPRPRIGGAGNELTALMQGLMGAQANDSGMAHLQRKVRGVPSVPQGMVGLQANISWACKGRAGVPQPQGEELGQRHQDACERHK
jgi:hypothetical protein